MDYGRSRAREASTRDMLRYRLCQKQSNKQSLTRYFLESFATAGKCSSIIKSTTFLHEKTKQNKKQKQNKKVHNWCSRRVRPTKTERAVHGCHIARVTVVLKNTVTKSSLHWTEEKGSGLKIEWITGMNNGKKMNPRETAHRFYHTGCGSWYRKYWH